MCLYLAKELTGANWSSGLSRRMRLRFLGVKPGLLFDRTEGFIDQCAITPQLLNLTQARIEER
jgi:hypothetical protein